jgi:hypothetical protein
VDVQEKAPSSGKSGLKVDFSNFLSNGTKGALVHKFLPLKHPCSVHDAARRASVALARG